MNRDSTTRIKPRVSSRCVAFDSKRVLPLQSEQSTGADTHLPWQKAILLETLFPGSSTCLLSLPLPLPFLYSPFSPPPPPLPPLCTPPSVFPHHSSPLFLFYSRFLPFSFATPSSPPLESFVSFSTYYFAPVHYLCLGLHHQSELSLICVRFLGFFFFFAIMQFLGFY